MWPSGRPDGVEVVERVTPEPSPAGVSAVALVGDDQVEGVDGDVEPVGIFLYIASPPVCAEWTFGAEEVPSHPLDRGNIDKRVSSLGICQILVRQNLGIKRRVSPKSSRWNRWL